MTGAWTCQHTKMAGDATGSGGRKEMGGDEGLRRGPKVKGDEVGKWEVVES